MTTAGNQSGSVTLSMDSLSPEKGKAPDISQDGHFNFNRKIKTISAIIAGISPDIFNKKNHLTFSFFTAPLGAITVHHLPPMGLFSRAR